MGVTANLGFGQRALFALGPELRSRLNGLYFAFFFVGGAIGSGLGGWAYAQGGWRLSTGIAIVLPLLALTFYAMDRRPAAKSR